MRRILSIWVAACLSASPVAAMAEPAPWEPNDQGDYLPDPSQEAPLSEGELIEAFSGMTHHGTYSFKRQNIETFAFVETTSADGRTVHQHGDIVDTGTWRVKENVICFIYEDWGGPGNPHCFNVFKRGNCFYHFGLSFAGTGLGGTFTARSVHAGETPDCEPSMV